MFWLDDLPAQPARPPLTGDRDADLAIVGGGYTGLWTALLAKRRDPDARIVIVEARTVGWAASGRNGGFCEASLTHGRDNGLSRWPDEIDQLDRLGMANLDAHGRRHRRVGRSTPTGSASAPSPWRPSRISSSGSMSGPRMPPPAAKRASCASSAPRCGPPSRSPTYLGAVLEKHSTALVHPGKLAAGLARAAEERGVEIFEHSPVRRHRHVGRWASKS